MDQREKGVKSAVISVFFQLLRKLDMNVSTCLICVERIGQ